MRCDLPRANQRGSQRFDEALRWYQHQQKASKIKAGARTHATILAKQGKLTQAQVSQESALDASSARAVHQAEAQLLR